MNRTLYEWRRKWARYVACMSKKRNAYKMFVEKPEGEILLVGSRNRREDNIKIDLKETGWEVVDWIHLARQALVNMTMKLRVP
jgi:hypothetical protein